MVTSMILPGSVVLSVFVCSVPVHQVLSLAVHSYFVAAERARITWR